MRHESGNWRAQRGQVLPIFVFCIVALIGISALVVDAGYWYREKRQLQAAVDAAALAGAQGLPDADAARDLASTYAQKNGLNNAGISVSTSSYGNDTISVKASRAVEGIFSRVLNVASVTVGASATATTQPLVAAAKVAPIAISVKSLNSPCGLICPGQSVNLNLIDDTGSGDFGLVSLDNQTSDQAVLAEWIRHGYSSDMSLGNYDAVTGNKYSSSEITAALSARVGTQLIIPVFSQSVGSGTGAKYTIVGWVGFDLTSFGDKALNGVAHRVVSTGQTGVQGQPTWSVVNIALTK